MSAAEPRFVPVLKPGPQAVLLALVLVWALATGLFWAWWLQPAHWAGPWGMAINTLLMVVVTALPLWTFYFVVQMQRVNPHSAFPHDLRLAMVVTKAPSEPWPLVQETLEAMLAQDPPHDTWLADEDPTSEVLRWCFSHGVRVSSRRDAPHYHNLTWPRRRRCKEGNLAYFYDHYGYALYDVVVQLDADHRPEPGYLRAMVQPFSDQRVGYVAAPSICDRNAASSWVARGRLHAESVLHGPLQLGLNAGFAPLCIGSHYAVRTAALAQIGGLGPELAEDHSTTLLLNSSGWRGVFAIDAHCHGLGPETFEDAMVQEFQWSRSLATILLSLTPRVVGGLPVHQRIQFFYCQLFYPLRGVLSVVGLLLPGIAMATAQPWVRVDYPQFLGLWVLQLMLSLVPLYWIRHLGLLNPPGSTLVGWEQMLFELTRGPWVLAGVLAACIDRVSAGARDFRVTSKQQQRQPLRLTFITPHLVIAASGALMALLLGARAGEARGYVLLILISAFCSVLAAVLALGLDHRLKRLSL
ncbi:MAG: glycosyltransferase, partial [Synechococcaceae bacterium WB9_2_112]|nr:glycosyltransferase [Synechococcaceae bacterium WB9_2_112]